MGRADAKAALESGKSKTAPVAEIEHTFANVMQAHYNTVVSELEKVSAYFTQ